MNTPGITHESLAGDHWVNYGQPTTWTDSEGKIHRLKEGKGNWPRRTGADLEEHEARWLAPREHLDYVAYTAKPFEFPGGRPTLVAIPQDDGESTIPDSVSALGNDSDAFKMKAPAEYSAQSAPQLMLPSLSQPEFSMRARSQQALLIGAETVDELLDASLGNESKLISMLYQLSDAFTEKFPDK